MDVPSGIRAVAFDVGETLVDESRGWSQQALDAGVTPFSLMAVIGALIERGEDHRTAWDILGCPTPRLPMTITPDDLYPDAVRCLLGTKASGFTVMIAGNQPASAVDALVALGCEADVVASSVNWGVAKPSKAFFTKLVQASGVRPDEILYVGDRLDNDILPAHAAGLRTAHLRRGPWGYIHARRPDAAIADMRIDSLSELTDALDRDPPDL